MDPRSIAAARGLNYGTPAIARRPGTYSFTRRKNLPALRVSPPPHRRRPRNPRPTSAIASVAPLPPVLEEGEGEDFSRELDVAVAVVQLACSLCQRIQRSLLRESPHRHVRAKHDSSPVTVADWSVQAAASWLLAASFPGERISIMAEEDAESLSSPEQAAVLDAVVVAVNNCLAAAPGYGLAAPPPGGLSRREILDAISRCGSSGGVRGKHWVLDPVDGTLGFVRGDQYAVALALIDGGEPVLGVLGCPNYPLRREWLRYHYRYFRAAERAAPPPEGSWTSGCVMYARRGGGGAWMQPVGGGAARAVRVSDVEDPAEATFCEPVETANSSHSFSAGVAEQAGLRNRPLRVYSMVKYAAVARGDAEVFIKFARSGYREKAWDHAAGAVIVEEAGGVVTDAGGRRLDFSGGAWLQGLDRGIVVCSGSALHRKIVDAVDASWGSSQL